MARNFILLSNKTIHLLFLSLMVISMPLSAKVDSLLNTLELTQNNEKKADLLNEIAGIYLYRNLDSALLYANEAITVSKNANYQKGEILALTTKSEIYGESGEYQKAMNIANRVKGFAESLNDKEILAKYYLLSGYNFLLQSNYNKGIEMAKQAFILFRENGDLSGMGDAQRRIAQGFIYWQEWDIMYEYYLSTLDCYQKAGDRRGIAASMNNIGVYFYVGQNNNEKAESYIHQAIALNKDDGNIYWLSKNYKILSGIKELLGQVDSSFYYSEQALLLAQKIGNPLCLINNLIDRGILYQRFKNDSAALRYYKEALHLSLKINSFESLSDVTDYIRNICFRQGFIDSAYFYLDKHLIYADSVTENNGEVKFTELKYQMETELEKQKLALQNQKRFFVFLLIFISLALIITILFLLYTKQKIKTRNTLLEKLNLVNKMELKNKELTSNILLAQKRNEMICSIVKHLEENLHILPEKSKNMINHVIKNLKNTVGEKGWEEFEMIFVQVHESFFNNLDHRFPGLSINQRRLCALLRLNLSSKEIAEITQTNPHSVDIARSRLRKKLGIEKQETDLIEFLRNI
jgi:tetratricopeptide (TPR) repeat protein